MKNNLTQDAVGRVLNCSGGHVSALERNLADIKVVDAIKLCRLYKVSVNELLGIDYVIVHKENELDEAFIIKVIKKFLRENFLYK